MSCCMGFGATVAWQWEVASEMAPPTTATGYAACEVLDGVQPNPVAALGREGGAEGLEEFLETKFISFSGL